MLYLNNLTAYNFFRIRTWWWPT